jgi:uncharacterized protein (DUF1697 family)
VARYVALLRGINVGGKHKVPMTALRAAFEDDGHTDVTTYIASGNVLFSSSTPRTELEDRLEHVLERAFGIPLVVVVRTRAQVRAVVADAPAGFGARPDTFHSDAVFLKKPLTAAKAMEVVETKEGVDRAWPGRGVVYFERLSAKRTASRMGRMIGTPEYQLMTIRSWQTTTKLASLLDQAGR